MQFGTNRGGVYARVDKATRKVAAGAITGPPGTLSFSKSYEEMEMNFNKVGNPDVGQAVLMSPRMESLGIWQSQMEEG